MTSSIRSTREAPRIELPRALLCGTGVTCGVLAAIAVQILFGMAGFQVSGLLQAVTSRQELDMHTVGAWWGIAGAAFLTGAAVAAALGRLPLPWRTLRLPRWLAGAAIVFGLGHIGHSAAQAAAGPAGAQLAASLAAFLLALLLALFGAYLTSRR